MSTILPRRDDAPLAGSSYLVELPISFAGGSGWTRLVSRHEVRFLTAAPLRPGDRIAGQFRFQEIGRPDTVVRYQAEVLLVRPLARGSRQREVHARFLQLRFDAGLDLDGPDH